jgi:predicted  nucleic acid-binding Zn-ribbon protein
LANLKNEMQTKKKAIDDKRSELSRVSDEIKMKSEELAQLEKHTEDLNSEIVAHRDEAMAVMPIAIEALQKEVKTLMGAISVLAESAKAIGR